MIHLVRSYTQNRFTLGSPSNNNDNNLLAEMFDAEIVEDEEDAKQHSSISVNSIQIDNTMN